MTKLFTINKCTCTSCSSKSSSAPSKVPVRKLHSSSQLTSLSKQMPPPSTVDSSASIFREPDIPPPKTMASARWETRRYPGTPLLPCMHQANFYIPFETFYFQLGMPCMVMFNLSNRCKYRCPTYNLPPPRQPPPPSSLIYLFMQTSSRWGGWQSPNPARSGRWR